jgi:hypothetical protein
VGGRVRGVFEAADLHTGRMGQRMLRRGFALVPLRCGHLRMPTIRVMREEGEAEQAEQGRGEGEAHNIRWVEVRRACNEERAMKSVQLRACNLDVGCLWSWIWRLFVVDMVLIWISSGSHLDLG